MSMGNFCAASAQILSACGQVGHHFDTNSCTFIFDLSGDIGL